MIADEVINARKVDISMKILVAEDYASMSRCAADLVQACAEKDPQGLVSFPGGDTPVGMVREFVSRVNGGVIDPTGLKFVQLDDWVGIGPQDEGSCSHFIRANLIDAMERPFADKFLFDGSRTDTIDRQLEEQDAFIRRYGPISVDVLGIGMNGHLGFNENGVDFSLRSHRTPLSDVTKSVQKKYFGGKDLPLTEGITLGIAQIMEAELVILLANGARKAEIVSKAITGPVTNEVPASILQKHPNCVYLLDQEAASLLPKDLPGMEIR